MGKQSEQQSVLVIEGDVLVRHAIADYLRDCGYTVVEASSTDEAMTVISDTSLPITAILCDAEAPGSINAFQFRLWVNRLPGRAGVEIALAGSIETAAHKAAELCEDGPNLARPYDPQSVLAYIRRMIQAAQS